ncbi:MAG: accessory gene regulator B family protein, partial [Anaerovorax sp.]
KQLAAKNVSYGIITQEDEELYAYAYRLLLSVLMSAVSFLLLGALFQRFLPTVFFIAAFPILRTFAGGIHASSYGKCYVYSLLFYALVIILCNLAVKSGKILDTFAIFLLSVSIIMLLAPVEDRNKPLSSQEFKRYRRITRIILLVEVVVAFGMMLSNFNPTCSIFFMAGPISETVLLLMAKINW